MISFCPATEYHFVCVKKKSCDSIQRQAFILQTWTLSEKEVCANICISIPQTLPHIHVDDRKLQSALSVAAAWAVSQLKADLWEDVGWF